MGHKRTSGEEGGRTDRAREIGLFRYALIRPVADPHAGRPEQASAAPNRRQRVPLGRASGESQPAEASFVHGHVGLELLGFGSPQRNGAQSGCSSAGGEGQRTQAARPIERRVAVRKSLGLTPISPQALRDRALTR